MVIKILFLLFLFPQILRAAELPAKLAKENARFLSAKEKNEVDAEKISPELKDWYWNSFEAEGKGILKEEELSDDLKTKQERFSEKKEFVSELEYKESEADKLEESVTAHLKLLQDKIYKGQAFVFLDYVTWQREAELKSAAEKTGLILTSYGYCGGGGWGKKNAFNYFFADGCLLFGYGNVAESVNNVTYRQTNVPTWGAKGSLGATRTVSSLGADVGLKLSVLYSRIDLDRPDPARFPGYKAKEGTDFMPLLSLVTSWPVMKGFIRSEFSHALDKDLTLWSLGLGYKF